MQPGLRISLRIGAVAGALALATSAALAGDKVHDLGHGVFSPEKGVVCDRKAGFCADGTGISMSWTEKYLGAEAVQKFQKNVEGGSFDETDFVLMNGVRCKIKEKACYKSKFSTELAPNVSKALFP
jgi:Fels-1 Prophage Protein-like